MKRSSTIPRPEYPRPQLVRTEWENLNGTWEFAFDDSNVGLTEHWFDGRFLPQKIIVPFAYQTALSGINDKGIHEIVWYARSFRIPKKWQGQDILLNFGAVDYRASIWINGQEVGHNQGGHVPFSFNIAPYLKAGENRLTVRVEDRQDVQQPRGKQASSGVPGEIDYYCTTGIWQTVWMEPVPKARIEEVRITPLFEQKSFEILTYLHVPAGKWKVIVTLRDDTEKVLRIEQTTKNATAFILTKIPRPKLWTPESPHLYHVQVDLYCEDEFLDSIKTYAGMRSIHVADRQFYLNNKPRYLIMALDQGYWPDGGMTAPTDEAIRADVEYAKNYGFNGVRKHQKVEDPRWLYWCDVLGLMVWDEMANARAWSSRAEEMLIAEWERVVERDYNHPCVIAWVPMNESWGVEGLRHNHPGQYAYLERIVSLTRRLDRFRPVVDNDGWEHTDITDICAIHDYTTSAEGLRNRYAQTLEKGELPSQVWIEGIPLFAQGSRYHDQPVILTEVGGFLQIPHHIPEEQRDVLYHSYGAVSSETELLQKYEDLMTGLGDLQFIAGFCYTQLYDVEHEINGLMTYDRKAKIDPKEIKKIHKRRFKHF